MSDTLTKEPDNYVVLLRRAREQVEASPLYRRFISGTPLENDIAVWMATFAAEVRIESMPNPDELADLRARLDAAEPKECEICRGCDGVLGSVAVICGWHYQEAIKSEVEAQVEIEQLQARLDAAEQELERRAKLPPPTGGTL